MADDAFHFAFTPDDAQRAVVEHRRHRLAGAFGLSRAWQLLNGISDQEFQLREFWYDYTTQTWFPDWWPMWAEDA